MEELVARITKQTGLDPATAEKAVVLILTYLQREGPPEAVAQLFAAIPGAEQAAAQSGDGGPGATGGGFMGMMGGGFMALGQSLMGAGVSMSHMQPLGRELFAFGREKAGEDVMGAIVGSIPGLSAFV
ncbi:MAG TPA: DUF2267 domain-containing protein [Microvirga sp.]|jgi:hypothetical protein|nr:DUF2267 domain-containing protein [Microvirga sp.]